MVEGGLTTRGDRQTSSVHSSWLVIDSNGATLEKTVLSHAGVFKSLAVEKIEFEAHSNSHGTQAAVLCCWLLLRC